MFSGPDAQLVQDAVIIAALAVAGGMGLAFTFLRVRKAKGEDRKPALESGTLEKRVQVLERIATDRSLDLADEIEKLRKTEETN